MDLTEPHTVAQVFESFAKQYPSDIVYPIFRLLRRVVLAFPKLESEKAVYGFIWLVGKIQTETVAAEKQKLAKRNKSTKRLETPLLRAYRQIIEYYFVDVQKYPDDPVENRIPRWGNEVKTLSVYKGKIDAPQPILLAWEYDLLLRLCDFIHKEMGDFSRWQELAAKLKFPQEHSTKPAIPVPWWPKGEYLEIYVPNDATPSEAAYLILSTKTRLSVERLRKLVQKGHRLFPAAVLEKVQQRWEKAFIDRKLGIIRVPLEDGSEFDLEEDLSFGFGFEETLFSIK
jgi:hypothetical protein